MTEQTKDDQNVTISKAELQKLMAFQRQGQVYLKAIAVYGYELFDFTESLNKVLKEAGVDAIDTKVFPVFKDGANDNCYHALVIVKKYKNEQKK